MLKSKKPQEFNTVHNLSDYAFSKTVVADLPKIIEIYRKLLPVLYEYAAYQGVFPVITMVEDSKMLLEMQLEYYSKIHKSKGKVNDGDQES